MTEELNELKRLREPEKRVGRLFAKMAPEWAPEIRELLHPTSMFHADRKLYIDEVQLWVSSTLSEMQYQEPPCAKEKCPYCNRMIFYPLVARKYDIDIFTKLTNAAHAVMNELGITRYIFAEIGAKVTVDLAKNGKSWPRRPPIGRLL